MKNEYHARDAQPYTSFQNPVLNFLRIRSGRILCKYGNNMVAGGPRDSQLFNVSALHGVAASDEGPVSYSAAIFTLRNRGGTRCFKWVLKRQA